MSDNEIEALIAGVPAALQSAVRKHVKPAQQEEVLLDIADVLDAMRARGEECHVAVYVTETIASLSLDPDARGSI